MTFPLWVILIPYAVYLVVYTALVLVDVFHLLRFGTFGFMNFAAFFIFLAGLVFLCYGTIFLLAGTDWRQVMWNGSIDMFTTTVEF